MDKGKILKVKTPSELNYETSKQHPLQISADMTFWSTSYVLILSIGTAGSNQNGDYWGKISGILTVILVGRFPQNPEIPLKS